MFNIALFGAGRIGQVHAANISSHPKTNLTAIIDPYEKGARMLAEKYDAQVMSIQDAMENPSIHAVCIGSATDTHADLIELAAKSNKAIFCEKPIDLSLERVRQCLATVSTYQVPMLVGLNRRYDPHFSALQQQYAKGAIGKAESLVITSRDPAPPPVEYVKVSGGLFRDMAIHDFDMARFILGEDPISVMAHGSCMVDEEIGKAGDIDTAVTVLSFPSGATATIINSRRSGYSYDQRAELHGSEGMLRVENLPENLVQQWDESGVQSAKPQPFFLERYEKAYQVEWQHFVDILERKTAPLCSGYDGEIALVIAEAATESMRSGQPVSL